MRLEAVCAQRSSQPLACRFRAQPSIIPALSSPALSAIVAGSCRSARAKASMARLFLPATTEASVNACYGSATFCRLLHSILQIIPTSWCCAWIEPKSSIYASKCLLQEHPHTAVVTSL